MNDDMNNELKEKFENLKRTYEQDDVTLAYEHWMGVFMYGNEDELEEVLESEEYDNFMVQVETDINEILHFSERNDLNIPSPLFEKLQKARDEVEDNDFLDLYDELLPSILEEAEFLGYL